MGIEEQLVPSLSRSHFLHVDLWVDEVGKMGSSRGKEGKPGAEGHSQFTPRILAGLQRVGALQSSAPCVCLDLQDGSASCLPPS